MCICICVFVFVYGVYVCVGACAFVYINVCVCVLVYSVYMTMMSVQSTSLLLQILDMLHMFLDDPIQPTLHHFELLALLFLPHLHLLDRGLKGFLLGFLLADGLGACGCFLATVTGLVGWKVGWSRRARWMQYNVTCPYIHHTPCTIHYTS
ncbi:hypothetical protein EON63_24125 [archaeon]|nr:MAG: hypothetical protein EON63_24125 [archaeon]